MKNIFIVIILLSIIYSCEDRINRSASETKLTYYEQAYVDNSQALSVVTDGFKFVIEQEVICLNGNLPQSSDFAKITVSSISKYPKYITLEFKGIAGVDNVVRDGKITATLDTVPWKIGATIAIAYSNYKINGVNFTGNQKITINEVDTSFNPLEIRKMWISSSVQDAPMLEAEGNNMRQARWWSEQLWEWTPAQSIITGNGRGVIRLGFNYQTFITRELVKDANCQYINTGELSIIFNSDTALISYDFNNGRCDNFANITLNDEPQELPFLPF